MEEYRIYTVKSEADKAIHMLEGILKGISCDNKINDKEIEELNKWINSYKQFKEIYPFKELFKLFNEILEDNIITSEEKQNLIWFCNKVKTDNTYYDMVTSDIQKLHGILHGIISDKNIKDEEIYSLKEWLKDNSHLTSTYPYDELQSILVSILKDNIITNEERKLLERFFLEFVDDKELNSYTEKEIKEIKDKISISGVCSFVPEIKIDDSKFCFTGKSSRCNRKEFSNVVEALGGKVRTCVSPETDYLIVGGNGNPCWAYACYGRKIEKAINLRSEGEKVMIVHENDFWDTVADLK